jgi:hypothetical protein
MMISLDQIRRRIDQVSASAIVARPQELVVSIVSSLSYFLLLGTTNALAATIDDFSSAANTAQPPGVTRAGTGTTSVADSGLSGVIGGTRRLDVIVTSAAPNQAVRAGVIASANLLSVASDDMANGRVLLLYPDLGGVDLSSSLGIRVPILYADAASPPYVVGVALGDASAQQLTVTETVTGAGATNVDLPFTSFPNVDTSHISFIRVIVDPNAAADMLIGEIVSYGTAESTPTLTGTATSTPKAAATRTATNTSTPTSTPTNTPTATSTDTPDRAPTTTPATTATPTAAPSNTPAITSTATATPTDRPTLTPTGTPAATPTHTPADTPTATPTDTPARGATDTPTPTPTETAPETPTPNDPPTATETPTATPADTPTQTASNTATETPTSTPTTSLTDTPTATPVDTPAQTATNTPMGTSTATLTDTPTLTPTSAPTDTPAATPTGTSIDTPTATPTDTPIQTPTGTPTDTASSTPTETPTLTPTSTPTYSPTGTPIPCELEVTKQCLVETSSGDLACQAKIAATTLRYIGPDVYGATVQFVGQTGATATYDDVDLISRVTVLTGQNGFTIDAAASGLGDLGATLEIFVNGQSVIDGVDQKLHTSCSTPYVAGQPAPLNDPKGEPSPNWLVENFRDKLGDFVSIPTPPTPSSNCTIDVPEPPHCRGAVKALSLRYLGGDCAETTNDQYRHVQCSGDAAAGEPVRIVVRRGSDIFLDTGSPADVQLGDIVIATAAAAGQQEFPTRTTIEILDDNDTLLQRLRIYTSCRRPLNLSDRFGSVEVTALSTTLGGDVSLGADVKYIYAITNTGAAEVGNVGVVDDLLGTIPGSPIASIRPGESVTLTTWAFVAEDTTNTVTVTADTTEGRSCNAEETATVTIAPAGGGDGTAEMPERFQLRGIRYPQWSHHRVPVGSADARRTY